MKSSLVNTLLAAWTLSGSAVLAQTSPATRPNIIFVLADDLGYGDIGVFFQNLRQTNNVRSEPWHFTPRLDAIAQEGIQLRGHYCPAPVCAPSRASFLQGVHQGHAGVRDNQFDKALENNHTVATVLQEAGYSTALIGKWGLQGSGGTPALWPAYPTKRGFDYYFGYVRHGDGHEHYPKEGPYQGAKEVWDQDTEVSSRLDKAYTADLFTARAKKWIVDQKTEHPERPFFLFLAYDTPHATTELPTQAYPAGSGVSGGLQWLGTPGHIINTASGTIDSYYHPDYANATWDHDANPATAEQAWPDVSKRYATSVRRIDDAVGDLVQTLKDLGVDDNTLIVFTSDNGVSNESYLSQALQPGFFNSFGPFDGIKRDTWEGGIRVGAIARWPSGIPADRVSESPSQFHDWLPTFAELAGVAAPARTDGVSLVPTLSGTGVQDPSTVYVEYYEGGSTPSYPEFQSTKRGRSRNQMQAIREGDYVGVRYNISNNATDFEIYNVATDPQELTNLASSQPALQQEFKNRVLRIRRPNSSAGRPYDSELVPSIKPYPVTNGVDVRVYTKAFPWVPKLDSLEADWTGISARPDLTVRPREDDFAVLFSGYITAPADGDYTFYTQADTGAVLRLHDATVLEADYGYAGGEVSGTIKLKAGRHPFRLYYARGHSGSPNLSLQWSSATIAKQEIPESAFFRDGQGAPVPPTAVDDSARTTRDTPVTVHVLDNDIDDGGPQPLSVVSVSKPSRGVATVQDGVIHYTPAAGFLGVDTFSYSVSDGEDTSTGKVSVDVTFADGTYWFPFNQLSGLTTREAGGASLATLRGFSSETAPWVDGRFNRGLDFDGIDDHLTIDGFDGILGANPRTVSAWIKTTATTNEKPIIAWGANSSTNKWTFLVNTAGRLRLEATGGWVVGTRLLNDGQWHHVAATFANDGTPTSLDIKLYVDGTPETLSTSQSVAINTTTSGPVKIGSDVQSRFWKGQIDEVRIYNRALSSAEVLALAQPADTTGQAWARRYFGAETVNWTLDDDQDGRPRLQEYAFGTQPQVGEASPITLAIPDESTGALRVSFPRRLAGTHNLGYQVEVSSDLVNWSTAPAQQVSSTPRDGEFEDVTYEAAAPVNAEKLFVRVRVTAP